jgi:Secretory lipase
MNTLQLESGRPAGQGDRAVALRRARRRRALSAAFALVVASALLPAAASALTAPASDPFYTQPANIAQYAHGTILRERQVTLSGATQTEAAAAYQLMYATTNATGRPVAAVTTVMVPASPAPGPRRLASYQTYYDSLTLNCAPSYTLQGGNNGGGTNGPTEQGLMSQLLEQGWDVVTSDYEGLDSEWAVGPMLGYATLDSITAVEHFAPAGLAGAKTEVTLNGYSGGSEASTWAAAFAPKYAPNLDIVGVAAGGNFPDLDYTTQNLDNSIWYGTEIGVLESFSRALPQDFDLSRLLNASGQALAAKDGQDGSGCAGSTLNEPYGNASQYTNFPDSEALAAYPPVKRGLEQLSLKNGPLPKAPLFLYNSVDDDLAFIQPVDAWVASYCRHGVTVDYDRDPAGGDHLSGIVPYWKATLTYLENAFAGVAPPNNCSIYDAEPASTPGGSARSGATRFASSP